MTYGPKTEIAQQIYKDKYLQEGETFEEAMSRIAATLGEGDHREHLEEILLEQKFLPAGRILASAGSAREVTSFNCFVSGEIEDSIPSIFKLYEELAETSRRGGGVGIDWSPLRPRGATVKSIKSESSGVIGFMKVADAIGDVIKSTGDRRSAMMAVLDVTHPDIRDFITAKHEPGVLTNFNLSVAVTDEFMKAVDEDLEYNLEHGGKVYETVRAREIWDLLMASTWDYAEPGVLQKSTINKKNNLHYCEQINATNPCGEIYLPSHGACLLGSFNLTKYVVFDDNGNTHFDFDSFEKDIPSAVRALDTVIDVSSFPLPEQQVEAQNKRRMGLGVTGLANTVEVLGAPYGSPMSMNYIRSIMETLRNAAYRASVELAKEKGAFPMFDQQFLDSGYAQSLPTDIREAIAEHGIRNSHLIAVAPTGTISLAADSISSGLEPVFLHSMERTIITSEGKKDVIVSDYAYENWGVKGKTAGELTPDEHVSILALVSQYCDSAVSKTVNVGDNVTFEEFKNVYITALSKGACGCTTFRAAGKRFGILREVKTETESEVKEGTACYIDPKTGQKECA